MYERVTATISQDTKQNKTKRNNTKQKGGTDHMKKNSEQRRGIHSSSQ